MEASDLLENFGEQMQAAVITALGAPPIYQEWAKPVPSEDEVLVEVLAAALYHLVRGRASGRHYSADTKPPFIPGVDAVVRDQDGQLWYTMLDQSTYGSMAEYTLMDPRRSIKLPPRTDPVQVAVSMNAAMSSWVALRQRITFEAGQRVLVLGATGNAGRLAIQISKRFGASEVFASGRNREVLAELPALGADHILGLDQQAAAADVDVVLDYIWGEPAAVGMREIITNRSDRKRQLTWVQIGSIAGQEAAIPAAALRSSRLQIVGSGIGSIAPSGFLAEFPEIAAVASAGDFAIKPRVLSLATVAEAWSAELPADERVVFVPDRALR